MAIISRETRFCTGIMGIPNDGRTDGQMDGPTDRPMDRRTNAETDSLIEMRSRPKNLKTESERERKSLEECNRAL